MPHQFQMPRGVVARRFLFGGVLAAIVGLPSLVDSRNSAAADDPPEAKNESSDRSERNANHLKAIAQAMQNYQATNGHFPPAVVMGPDGKTLHSWRVELLPYLDHKPFRDPYRMGEPWDSPNNKRVLEQMPEIFKSPYDDSKSTSSGYYVIVGPGTLFEGKTGIVPERITDGTSETLLVVEAKQGVPWTKPEDIPFDPAKPLPKLGGFVRGRFGAVLADGTVRIFESDSVKDQLQWLIVRNDGHGIDWQKIGFVESPVAPVTTTVTTMPMRPGPIGQNRLNQDRNHLKMLALAMHNYHDVHNHFPPAAVMGPDGKTPHSWRIELLPFLNEGRLFNQYNFNERWDGPNNRRVLAQMPDTFRSPWDRPNSVNSGYFALVGRGTAFEGKNGIGIADIVDGTSNTLMFAEAKRSIPWTKPEDIPFNPDKPLPELGGFIRGQFCTALCDGSVRVLLTSMPKDQLKWLIMRNDMQVINWQRIQNVDNRNVVIGRRAAFPGNEAVQTRNNLKQVALAMHNYHDVHRHFPPAVVMGPDGKTPHSWRVELLPFLEQQGLYEQYRMNEPWNSPNNKKVLAQIPDVFRSPYDDPKSTNSGYYAFVGPGTVFEGKDGVRIRDITDGTSNTLMVVETKKNVPWTKPEDIPFDPEKRPPQVGGFVDGQFTGAMCDGSVQRFDTKQVKGQLLKWLIICNDGNVINLP